VRAHQGTGPCRTDLTRQYEDLLDVARILNAATLEVAYACPRRRQATLCVGE